MTLSPTTTEIGFAVDNDRLARLVGYPPEIQLAGPFLGLAAGARSWFERNGDPWTRTRALPVLECGDSRVRLADGLVLSAPLLASRLRRCEPHELVIAAVSAGPAVDRRVEALWADERPDEAFFLDRYATAVTESLAAGVGRNLRLRVRGRGLSVLPAMSPGCEDWLLADQAVLADALRGTETGRGGKLVVLDSGALSPKSSLLAILAVASGLPAGWDRVEACSWCSLPSCGVRRNPPVLAAGSGR